MITLKGVRFLAAELPADSMDRLREAADFIDQQSAISSATLP